MLEAIIDKLTRSIEERVTGRALDTEVAPTSLTDIEAIDEVWLFDWKQEVSQKEAITAKFGWISVMLPPFWPC